jgi:tetratricopeptide (TPR) repeat protein
MIVKNESKIITRLFDSVVEIIDSYCICDTGSTDNTVELIQNYFKHKNIPGRVVKEPFRDFGYNRTFAIEQCENQQKADYLLLMDADMVLQYGNGFDASTFKNSLVTNKAHYIFQGTNDFQYKNVRIVKNNEGIKYWGVTHEYIQVPDGTTYGTYVNKHIFIHDIGDGGSKSDKYVRDVRLLTEALEKNPNNDRYTFYLASSLRDSGQRDKAIETYKKRIGLGGWIEEIWYSCYSIARIYRDDGDMERAVYWFMEAFAAYPNRIENLYEIVTHYRNCGKNELAYEFYKIADARRKATTNYDFLFLEKDIYDYKLDYEMSIIGYYHNPDKIDMVKCCMKLLMLNNWTNGSVMSNYKFYVPTIQGKRVTLSIPEPPKESFVSSTPALCVHNGELVCNYRFVNYKINDEGGYDNQEFIETINIISRFALDTLDKIGENLTVQHDRSIDNRYVGLEDIRLLSDGDKLTYSANRGLDHGVSVESGSIDINTGTVSSVILSMANQRDVEKNWVLYKGNDYKTKCIYGWNPLIVGDITDDGIFYKTHQINMPHVFKNVRGSTNGVEVGNEVWFICHAVSYEDRRYYYHMFVALNKVSNRLSRFSDFVTFEKQKVEYTLGFVQRDPENFLIGYSLMDRETKFMSVTKEWINGAMSNVVE